MLMAQMLAVLMLVGMLATPHAAERSKTNYCEQEASWKAWQALLAKHPDDQGLQALHALRIGICVQVRRQELSVEQGTHIFEKARQALLTERHETAHPSSSKLLQP